jgi:hypothetical protein
MSQITTLKVFITIILFMGVILVVGTSLINHFVPKESISNPVMIDNSKNTPIIEQQLIVNQPTELKVYQYPLTLPKKPVKPMVTATPVFIPTVTPTIKPPTVTPKPFNLIPDDLDYNRFPKSGTDVHGNIEIGDCVSLAPNMSIAKLTIRSQENKRVIESNLA